MKQRVTVLNGTKNRIQKRISRRTFVFMMIISMLFSLIPNMNASARTGNFMNSERMVWVQYVPSGNGDNCYSNMYSLMDGSEQTIRLDIIKDESSSDETIMTIHAISVKTPDEKAGVYYIELSNAKVVTKNGQEIDLDDLDGAYKLDAKDTTSQSYYFASTDTNPATMGDLAGGYFSATVRVKFEQIAEVASKEEKLKQLADVNGNLPADCYYEVEKNIIQLVDFSFGGSLKITGNDNYDSVILVIRGKCNIDQLVLECPVTIRRYAYSSLSGTSLTGTSRITYDSTYNRSKLSETSGAYSISFNDGLTSSQMTQGEKDEASGKYSFLKYPWRSRNSDWYQTAISNIEKNRMQDVTVKIIDKDGKEVESANVLMQLADYDYLFGSACTGVSYYDGAWNYMCNFEQLRRDNFCVSYDDFVWENYDNSYENDANNTYSFDYSKNGNSNYLRDYAKNCKNNKITLAAQTLVAPSIKTMTVQYNRENTTVADDLKRYIFSDEYTPEGFNNIIKAHIEEEIKSYAGYVYLWCVVNEETYSKEFFQLIYGVDDTTNSFTAGNGLSKTDIQKILVDAGKQSASTDAKMTVLSNYLDKKSAIPAEQAGKIVCDWAYTAQQAWNETIGENSWYTADDLVLYCNDACWKNDTTSSEKGHYEYFNNYAKALSNPENYPDGKVLVNTMGLQFAQWGYRGNPLEILEMLDDLQNNNQKLLVTEGNYWVDNPYSDTGVSVSDYGSYNGKDYLTSDITSQAEKEFIYDYGYMAMTALYSHPASMGANWVSYPMGQIGCRYLSGDGYTPLGDAYSDLTMKDWNTYANLSYTPDNNSVKKLSCGTYSVSIAYNGQLYQKDVEINKGTSEVTIKLDNPFVDKEKNIYATLYEDCEYSTVKEKLGKFATMQDLETALGDKEGYLRVKMLDDCEIENLPEANLTELQFQSQTPITFNSNEISFTYDVSLDCDLIIKKEEMTINGNGHTLKLLTKDGGIEISGGTAKTEELSLLIGGNSYGVISANVDGLDHLYVSKLEDGYSLDSNNIDDAWAHIENNANLLVTGSVSNVDNLHMYGKSIYLDEQGSMSVAKVDGIYGDVYLKKHSDGHLSEFTVSESMQDMIWQLRIQIFKDTLQKDDYVISVTKEDNCTQGIVLAYIPDGAHSSVKEKLGWLYNDDWEEYGKKKLLDGRLYYDDGSTEIDHLWENTYTEDVPATCKTPGKKSIHCSVCDVVKNETEIPATGAHDFSKYVSIGKGRHKVVCNYCNTLQEGHDADVCSGGTATCTAKAKCSKCGVEYGELGDHSGTKIAQVDATCTSYGVKEYYKCICGKCFADAACTKEISDIEAWKSGDGRIDKIDHSYTTTVTKATLTDDGKKETKCTRCGKVINTEIIYAAKTIKLTSTKYTYDGKVKKPSVTIVDSAGNKIDSSNYTVTYPSGRKNVGKYTVEVVLKEDYSGTKKLSFTINPAKTSISKLTAGKKAFTAKWTKKTTQVSGYEIQYSTSSTFAKGNKIAKVTSAKTVSKTISKLTGGKKYYVRIRTYKTVSGVKYYSDWSAKKSVKTKK